VRGCRYSWSFCGETRERFRLPIGPGARVAASELPSRPSNLSRRTSEAPTQRSKCVAPKGDHWVVKFGGEIHSDVLGERLFYALGYVTSPTYFVRSGVISGAHDLRRAKHFIGKDGAFHYARFKLHDKKELARV